MRKESLRLLSRFSASALLLLAACAPTLRPVTRAPSEALPAADETSLGRAVADETRRNPGRSGFRLLASGAAALGARVALVDAAERTLDVEDRGAPLDEAGPLLSQRLLAAADRGVKVRILLDDLPSGPTGVSLPALAAHPNIQLRLFNPLPRRTNFVSRMLDDAPADPRSDRRLHSRAFVADNAVGTVGGRFGGWQRADGDPGAAVEDLELLAVGPVLQQVSASFGEFWNSDLSVPVQAVLEKSPNEADLQALRNFLRGQKVPLEWIEPAFGLRDLPKRLHDGSVPLTWAEARLVADHPVKDASPAAPVAAVSALIDATRSELLIVSPYFVPGRAGMDLLVSTRSRGVATRVLTWSLSATDLPTVEAVYARYRVPLLEKKVELFELRWPLAGSGAATPPLKNRSAGDSALGSYHARTLVFDRSRLFVGTVALDPQLATYATSLGVVVESEELARQLAVLFEGATKLDQSFRLALAPEPHDPRSSYPVWITVEKGREVQYEREPETSIWNRVSKDMRPLFAPEGL